jgi:gliding motility-associated-like protein
MSAFKKILLAFSMLLFLNFSNIKTANATHLYGAELFYTYVSGNQYTVTMIIYGDCGGTASVFAALYTATPEIKIYNGSATYRTMYLKVQSGSGTEVTPVCPSSLSSTTCNGGTVPGIKRFIYSDTITIGSSANWKFHFTGNLISSSSVAGRSGSLTNIVITGGSGPTMALEATLDNTAMPNSNPSYTTIPTPFFCVGSAQEYNQGAVDPNTGDSLDYTLVPGIDAAGGTVTYISPYTATAPLATATGTFSFSNTTGQLSFTPNLLQKSLVVSKVSEYRSGVLVGTSMREMTFIVLSCSNRSPNGKISSVTGGTATSNTTVDICKNQNLLTFNINPVDSDGDNITVSYAGLPTGATLTVTGSGGKTPTTFFSWNITNVAAGTYYFFVTYQDDACPLSSKQTIAYTINVLPKPALNYALVSSATCVKKAIFTITPSGTGSPWKVSALSGITTLHSITGVTTAINDSLAPGTYTLRLTNSNNCYYDTTIIIASPPAVTATIVFTNPLCIGSSDGTITASGTGSIAPYLYAIGSGTYTTTSTFTGLNAATYTIHIKDGNSCVKDTNITLSNPAPIVPLISTSNPLCVGGSNGSITATGSGSTTPYTYAIDAGSFSTTGNFTGLNAKTYTIHTKDSKGCSKDTIVTLNDPAPIVPSLSIKNPTCNPISDGKIFVSARSGLAPYQFALGSGSYSTATTFTSLNIGSYIVHIKDANNCIKDTNVILSDSITIMASAVITEPNCFGYSDGKITLTPTKGIVPFNYALGAGSYITSNVFSGLGIGVYAIHLKDSIGCLNDISVTVTQPSPIGITIVVNKPSCNGYSDGSITITGTGGTPGYSYAIGSGSYSSSSSITGLTAGAYILHIKDINGCTKDTNIVMSEPAPLFLDAIPTPPLCFGEFSATVSFEAFGGSPDYKYAYDDITPQTSSPLKGLNAGSHLLHLIDKNGCKKDSTIFITTPTKLLINNISIINPTCEGYADGMVSVTATGGINPYKYAIDSSLFNNNNIFTKLKEGSYSIHVKDSNNCQSDTTIQLIGYPHILFDSAVTKSTSCWGLSDGSFTLFASGGNPPFKYSVVGFPDTVTIAHYDSLQAGNYVVTITDFTNCNKTVTVNIAQPDPISLQALVTPNDCIGLDTSGAVSVLASGGTQPYSYLWSTGASDSSIHNLENGNYALLVTDKNNCKDSITSNVGYDNCCKPTIPNAFTPNGDGKNDVFYIIYKGDIELKEFSIYNRYGQKVFTTSNINMGWNGRVNDEPADLGTYYYYVKLICGNKKNNIVDFKGDVTLIR